MTSKCTLCPLHKDSTVNLLSGDGPQPAKIIFIGEGPGEEEERSGVPFTGPAGKLFDQLLTQAGILRSQVRITNIVRCRPIDKSQFRTDYRGVTHFGNRVPEPEEAYTCAPTYLDDEIQATQPNVIVPVGNTALHYIAGEYKVVKSDPQPDGTFKPTLEKTIGKVANITAEAGVERWSEKYQCKIIPIIHPSALLRGARQINTTVEALKRIKIASESKSPIAKSSVQYVTVDTFEMVQWVIDRLKTTHEFAFDVETTGFDWMRDRLICIGFSWRVGTGASVRWLDEQGNPLYTDEQRKWFLDELSKLFTDYRVLKVGHNLKFDAHHLMSVGIPYPKPGYDTMLAHHMLDSETEHGLKTLSWIYTDMGGYEDKLQEAFAGIPKMKRDFMSIPRDVMGYYNAADCDCTLRLKYKFVEMMEDHPKMKEFFHTWVKEFSETVLTIERSGVPIDFAMIKDMYERMSVRCGEIESEFRTQLGITEFNLNSSKQLREIFFVKLGLTPGKMGKTGPSLDEESLKDLQARYPDEKLVGLVSDYRSLKKSMSTYLIGIKNSALFGRAAVDDLIKEVCWTPEDARAEGIITDGRVHCDFLLHGTVTGRLSSRNPNLQNIPRVTDEDKARGFVIRSIFKADPGWKLLAADLSSAELWVLQALSKDAKLRDALLSPEGVHYRFASQLFRIPWTSVNGEQKAIAKTVVFGIVYGRQANSIAEQFKITLQTAQSYVDGFKTAFPAVAYWMDQAIEQARRERKSTSPFGRIRYLPGIVSPQYTAKLDAEHQAINFPIQSSASDITQIAGTRIRWEIEKRGLRSRPAITIHDDNTYHVPTDELEIMEEIVKTHMEAFVPELGISTLCKIKIGDRWVEDESDMEIISEEDPEGESKNV